MIASFLFGVPKQIWLIIIELLLFAIVVYVGLLKVQNLFALLLPIPTIVGIRFLTTQFSKASIYIKQQSKDIKYYAHALDVALKRRGFKKKDRLEIIQEVFRIKLKR